MGTTGRQALMCEINLNLENPSQKSEKIGFFSVKTTIIHYFNDILKAE